MFSLIASMGSTVSSDAAATGASGSSMWSTIIMLVVFVAIFYFLLIRPQRKRDKEAKDMMASLKKGDKVVTIGGIRGTVAAVKDTTVVLKVDSNARIEFSKNAISQILNQAPAESKPEKADKQQEIVEAPKAEEETEAAEEVKTNEAETAETSAE